MTLKEWTPRNCPNCGDPVPYKKWNPKFCSQSCAASFNNRGIQHNPAKKPDPNPSRKCLACGEKVKPRQKYCDVTCQTEAGFKVQISIVERTGDVGKATTHLRFFMLRTQIHRCTLCGGHEWQGKPIPLVVDHINGNPTDNRLVNLRLICPNCDAQLPTFTGRNRGNGRESRRKVYARLGYC